MANPADTYFTFNQKNFAGQLLSATTPAKSLVAEETWGVCTGYSNGFSDQCFGFLSDARVDSRETYAWRFQKADDFVNKYQYLDEIEIWGVQNKADVDYFD